MIIPSRKESSMPTVAIGDPAPDFSVTASNGEQITLSDYRDKQAVVLFFYPADHSPICSQEACAFRDAYDDFVQAGAVLIGVSGDSDVSHQRFAENLRLPYHLVADEQGTLRQLYGVPTAFMFLPGRVTYVIDRTGIVRLIFNSSLQAAAHTTEALRILQQLKT